MDFPFWYNNTSAVRGVKKWTDWSEIQAFTYLFYY